MAMMVLMISKRVFFKGNMMRKTVFFLSMSFSALSLAMDNYETRVKQSPDMVVSVNVTLQKAMYNTKLALLKCSDDADTIMGGRMIYQDSLYPELGIGEIMAHGIVGNGVEPFFIITFTAEESGTKIQSWSHKPLIKLGNGQYGTTKNIDKLAIDGVAFDCSFINGKKQIQNTDSSFGRN